MIPAVSAVYARKSTEGTSARRTTASPPRARSRTGAALRPGYPGGHRARRMDLSGRGHLRRREFVNRPGLQRLLADLKRTPVPFQSLVISEPSRLRARAGRDGVGAQADHRRGGARVLLPHRARDPDGLGDGQAGREHRQLRGRSGARERPAPDAGRDAPEGEARARGRGPTIWLCPRPPGRSHRAGDPPRPGERRAARLRDVGRRPGRPADREHSEGRARAGARSERLVQGMSSGGC